ncbi:MAG TPA: hypothetical protein VH092_20540, partial [Urbifossiella sp.]|nr:hypothetical protein [Urbifossiella sp.]
VTTEPGPKGPLTCIILDGEKASVYSIWLDPEVNWLVRKFVREVPGFKTAGGQEYISSRDEYEIEDFVEVRPAIYFPTKMTCKGYLKGEHSVTQEAEFTSVRVNDLKVPPFPMRLPTATGMVVADELTGTTYTSDADGNPAGKQSVLRHAPAVDGPVRPDPTAAPESSIWYQSSTWFIALAMCFALGAAALVYRRRRTAMA